jgi:hypothetical protein
MIFMISTKAHTTRPVRAHVPSSLTSPLNMWDCPFLMSVIRYRSQCDGGVFVPFAVDGYVITTKNYIFFNVQIVYVGPSSIKGYVKKLD